MEGESTLEDTMIFEHSPCCDISLGLNFATNYGVSKADKLYKNYRLNLFTCELICSSFSYSGCTDSPTSHLLYLFIYNLIFEFIFSAIGKASIKPGYVLACYTPESDPEEFWLLKVVRKSRIKIKCHWFNKMSDILY